MSDTEHSQALLTAIAQVLFELAGSAEDLGEALGADPTVLAQHHVQLQHIDLFSQTLCQLADILASQKPASALNDLRLDGLRVELLQKSEIATA